jgi:prefoldin subunit 5
MTREQEIEMLKDQAKYFQDALSDITKRIGEIEQEA